ncbi:hypothetical protein ACKFKG_21105 [Phormidesmis sp. 146-35]
MHKSSSQSDRKPPLQQRPGSWAGVALTHCGTHLQIAPYFLLTYS